MRILFAHSNLGWFGGVEQNVADSARELRRRGHACLLAHGPEQRAAAAFAAIFDAAAPCRELGSPDPAARDFAELAREWRPDLVYLHKAPPDLAANGIPRVQMIHDHDACCPRRHKYLAWNGRICEHPAGWRCWLDAAFLERDRSRRSGLRWAPIGPKLRAMRRTFGLDGLLVGSRFMARELVMNGCPPERIRVVPPAVAWTAPADPPPPPEARELLYVGQLIRGKGVDLLLEALTRVPAPWRLRLAGDGNARPALEGLVRRLGLAAQVEFLGFVPHERLQELYDAARVCVVPSRWPEPFGMVGVEAMAHARPVVAFAAGGIPDWLADGETGLLAPPGDVAALAAALTRVLDDHELACRLGAAGRRRALEHYAFPVLVDHLEQTLEDLRCASA